MRTGPAAVKLGIFAVTTTLATGLLAMAIGGIDFRASHAYRAIFTDVSGLVAGDDVRIAGVVVGEVTGISLHGRDQAEVSFTVQASRPLAVSTRAVIRYQNLVGERYLEITEGKGPSKQLPPGGMLPVAQTDPALDLTVLFNGFKPLFQALDPEQVNKLSHEIVAVLQGEGGTIRSLLANTASLTNTLANRDKVIGEVIDNLNAVLATLDERDERLSTLVVQLQKLVSGLAADSEAIGDSLSQINALTDSTASLLKQARPSLRADIRELGELSKNLNQNSEVIDDYLARLPGKLNAINRTASYGSWFNFYLCGFDASLGTTTTAKVTNESPRCAR